MYGCRGRGVVRCEEEGETFTDVKFTTLVLGTHSRTQPYTAVHSLTYTRMNRTAALPHCRTALKQPPLLAALPALPYLDMRVARCDQFTGEVERALLPRSTI